MTDLFQRIVGQRSSLENLMAKVPGYRGYKEATDRRAADRLIREHVVMLLKEQLSHLVTVEKKIINSGGLSLMGQLSDAKMNFQTFIDRVNTAAPGYAGFFDALKVGPDELAKIYSFDAALVSYADKFKEKINALDAAAADARAAAVTDLATLAAEANSAYKMRETLLTGLS